MSTSSSTSDKNIALLVTVYNRQHKLERMLRSLHNELSLIDIIIIDDGSTPAVSIEDFADYPITLIRVDQNIGISKAANKGFQYILEKHYKYIARLDSDDTAKSNRFKIQSDYLDQHPEIGLVGSDFERVDTDGNPLTPSYRVYDDQSIRQFMHIDCMLQHSTWMMRTSMIHEAGFYNETYLAAEDYEYAWRIMNCCKVANIKENLVVFEVGSQDTISSKKYVIQHYNAFKVKLLNFNVFSFYSYAGIGYSVLRLTNMESVISCLKKWWFRK